MTTDKPVSNLDALQWPVESSTLAEKCSDGNFGAVIQDGKFLLHPDTVSALQKAKMRTKSLIEFISYAQSFPTSIAWALEMTNQGAVQAYNRLKEQLKPYVPDNLLNFEPPQRFYGARMPEGASLNVHVKIKYDPAIYKLNEKDPKDIPPELKTKLEPIVPIGSDFLHSVTRNYIAFRIPNDKITELKKIEGVRVVPDIQYGPDKQN